MEQMGTITSLVYQYLDLDFSNTFFIGNHFQMDIKIFGKPWIRNSVYITNTIITCWYTGFVAPVDMESHGLWHKVRDSMVYNDNKIPEIPYAILYYEGIRGYIGTVIKFRK